MKRPEPIEDAPSAKKLKISSLFQLQTDELAQQSVLSKRPQLEKALFDIKETLSSLPQTVPSSLHSILKKAGETGVAIPWPQSPPTDSRLKFSFMAPLKVAVVGSFLLKSALKGKCVDLALQMPSELFQDKDFLDFRYFQ